MRPRHCCNRSWIQRGRVGNVISVNDTTRVHSCSGSDSRPYPIPVYRTGAFIGRDSLAASAPSATAVSRPSQWPAVGLVICQCRCDDSYKTSLARVVRSTVSTSALRTLRYDFTYLLTLRGYGGKRLDPCSFSRNGANGPESRTTRMFRPDRQVAAPGAKSAVSDCTLFMRQFVS